MFSLAANACRTRVTWAALLAVAATAASSRADHLDEGLSKHARAIMKDIRDHDYKNVGVLKFQLQKGTKEPTLKGGLFNVGMASRLENALVLANDEKDPIGITHDASLVALRQDRKATYLSQAGRQDLFRYDFPLAWGKEKVKPDAFLTGIVKLSKDFKTTTVVVQAFDVKSLGMREVTQFTLKTDRSILSDVGQSFAISKRAVQKTEGLDEERLNDLAVENAFRKDQRDPKSPNTGEDVPLLGKKGLIKFEAVYDGIPAVPEADAMSPGEYRLLEPTETQKVSFQLTNNSPEVLAVEVRVNGMNTLSEEEDKQPGQYTKWILEPGKTYGIRGFYAADGKSVKRFRILPKEDTSAAFADSTLRGYVTIDVFQEAAAEAPEATRRGLSLRGLSRKDYDKAQPDTLRDAKARLRSSAALAGIQKKGVIAQGDGEAADVKNGEFKNAIQTDSIRIHYLDR